MSTSKPNSRSRAPIGLRADLIVFARRIDRRDIDQFRGELHHLRGKRIHYASQTIGVSRSGIALELS